MVSHCGFNLHLSDGQWCRTSFHMSPDPLYVLLGEVSLQVLCPFLNCIVCCPGMESCQFFIYFGDQNLVQVLLANIFSHTIGSFSILLMYYLTMQKLFNLIRSHLFILSFMSLALGDISVKILLRGISEIFLCLGKCSPLGFLWFCKLYLSLLPTLSLILFMV